MEGRGMKLSWRRGGVILEEGAEGWREEGGGVELSWRRGGGVEGGGVKLSWRRGRRGGGKRDEVILEEGWREEG